MSRWLLASMLFGTGFTWVAFALAPAVGADKETQASSSRNREEGDDDPAKRIDRSIQSYESRADQELDQTRKEISRLRKELTELVELQNDMAISLAELQAELRVQAAARSGDDDNDGSRSEKSSNGDDDRKRLRAMELNRELRQVQENLRSLVLQKRNDTDQLVSQLRDIRAQQRQAAAEREKSKQAEGQSKD